MKRKRKIINKNLIQKIFKKNTKLKAYKQI